MTMSRKQAHSAGLKRYNTGRPCINGHSADRYVTTGGCIECLRESQRTFVTAHKRQRTARMMGAFGYLLHKDDHAAALAYCQALDMQRGLMPRDALRYDRDESPMTSEQIQAERRRIFAGLREAEPEPFIPKL